MDIRLTVQDQFTLVKAIHALNIVSKSLSKEERVYLVNLADKVTMADVIKLEGVHI